MITEKKYKSFLKRTRVLRVVVERYRERGECGKAMIFLNRLKLAEMDSEMLKNQYLYG